MCWVCVLYSATRLQRDRWASDIQPGCCSCSKCRCLPGVSVDEVQFVSPNEQCVRQTPPHILLIVVDSRRSCSLLNFRLSIPSFAQSRHFPTADLLCLLYIFISFLCLLSLLLLLSLHCSLPAPLSSLTKLMIAVQKSLIFCTTQNQREPKKTTKQNTIITWFGKWPRRFILFYCLVA